MLGKLRRRRLLDFSQYIQIGRTDLDIPLSFSYSLQITSSYLTSYDCVTFHSYLETVLASSQLSQHSGWVLLPVADVLLCVSHTRKNDRFIGSNVHTHSICTLSWVPHHIGSAESCLSGKISDGCHFEISN